ncbi:MAG: hypothetical protein ACOC0V_00615 [Oceanicaulis sp.]
MLRDHAPKDLVLTEEDPFAPLNLWSEDELWRAASLPDPRLYLCRMFRTRPVHTAEYTTLRLGQTLADGGYRAILFDYREAEIDHEESAFRPVVDAMAAAFPRSLIIVYLHDAGSHGFAKRMTNLLQDRGVKAGRARSFGPAFDAVVRAISSPAG